MFVYYNVTEQFASNYSVFTEYNNDVDFGYCGLLPSNLYCMCCDPYCKESYNSHNS